MNLGRGWEGKQEESHVGREGSTVGPVGREVPKLAGSKKPKPVPAPPCKDIWKDWDNRLGLINAESGQMHKLC